MALGKNDLATAYRLAKSTNKKTRRRGLAQIKASKLNKKHR